MKKYFILALRTIFYISSLLFFEPSIMIIPTITLIALLFLENKKYSFLPLLVCIYTPRIYTTIIIVCYFFILLFKNIITKDRKCSIIFYSILVIFSNVVLHQNNLFNINTLFISFISFVIYGLSTFFYIYHKNNRKQYTISINDNLLNLLLLVGYLLLISIYNPNPYLLFLLFMQLYILNDIKYNAIFFTLLLAINLYKYKSIDINLLAYLSSSFIPPTIIISLDFTKYISYLYLIYSVLITLVRLNKKNITIENDYVNYLFNDFKLYINNLTNHYDQLNTIKELKENHLLNIQELYCNNCNKNTLCRHKLDKRFSFLCNAMNNDNNNIYDCPNYNKFYFNYNSKYKSSLQKLDALTNLADELQYSYIQNIKNSKAYNKFFNELMFYNYEIQKIDINLSEITTNFSVTLSKNKLIIKELILKLATKAFKENLEIKVVDTTVFIYKKPKVKLDYSHKILPKTENIISGDNYYIKKNYNDSYIFALSDGMGSGHHAFAESSDALKLISGLLAYHFSLKTVLKLLEGIYDLKCDFDSYATLDIININTSNMKLNLYKLGSTTTYIYHNNELISYENKALPLKLDDINSSYEIEYFIGDVIILMSDGISDYYPKDQIEYDIDFTKTSKEITDDITNNLLSKYEGKLNDDSSLIVIKII